MFGRKRTKAIVIDANMPLRWAGALHEEGFQRYFKKLEGFIPWMVHVELAVMYWKAKQEKEIKENGTVEELEKLEELLLELSEKDREKRKKKGEAALIAYPFVQEKIEQGKWKLVGKDVDIEPYLCGLNEGVVEKLKISDAKIIATCLFLADGFNFREVILLSRDADLRKTARSFGIKTEGGISNLIKN